MAISKLIKVHKSTLFQLRQLQQSDETFDGLIRRLCGFSDLTKARKQKDGKVPRETKYKRLYTCQINEQVVLPWQLDDKGERVKGQNALVMALKRCSKATGFRFVEQPSFGAGLVVIRIA